MEANNFLNKKQVDELNKKKWFVIPNGKCITLYKEHFDNNAWEEMCQQLDIPATTEFAYILYYGMHPKKENIINENKN